MIIHIQLLAASYNEELNLRLHVFGAVVATRQLDTESAANVAERARETLEETTAAELDRQQRKDHAMQFSVPLAGAAQPLKLRKHPSTELFEEYWLGRLAPARVRALERHVRSCRKCAKRLEAAIRFIRSVRPALGD